MMKPTLHPSENRLSHWLKSRHVLISFLFLLVGLLGTLSESKGQSLYGAYGSTFSKYDIATKTWTTLASRSVSALTTLNGEVYGISGAATQNFAKYNPATNSWTELDDFPGVAMTVLNGEIYAASSTNFAKYNSTTDSWTVLTNDSFDALTVLNGEIYGGGILKNFAKYNATANAWSSSGLTNRSLNTMAVVNGQIHAANTTGNTFFKYLPASGIWTDFSARSISTLAVVNGVMYGGSVAASSFASFDLVTSAWDVSEGDQTVWALTGVEACSAPPVFSVSATAATCTGSAANSNAGLTVSAGSGGSSYGYSLGSTYTGPAFASATSFTGTGFSIAGLPNPTVNQPYTVRIYCNATTYTDKVVMLTPARCQSADLRLSVGPTPQTGSSGELRTYTVTLTNAGPDPATNVTVRVPMPTIATLQAAQAAMGSYNQTSNLWTVPSLTNGGSTTLTFTVKVN